MQGTILSIASQSSQGLILGDDGIQYTYTYLGWRDTTVGALPGMKVDFDIRGSHAVGIYPLPGAAPSAQFSPGPPAGSFQPPPPTFPGGGARPPAATPQPAQPPYVPPTAPPTPSAEPPAAQQSYPPQVPQQFPASPPPSPPPQNTPYAPAPQYASAPPPSAPQLESGGMQAGKIFEGVVWMFFLSALISIILPFIGPMIGGFVGGRKSGGFINAAMAAVVAAVLIGGVTYLIAAMIVSFIEGLPVIGLIILATPIGDLLTGGAVILALLNALPMLIFALLGGATKGS